MVRFINKTTGTEMWVAEDRVQEYTSAGHRLADEPISENVKPVTRKRKTKQGGR